MSERSAWLARLAPATLLLLLAGSLLGGPVDALRLESAAGGPAAEVDAALDEISFGGVVLVGFDPDLGTYAEIRPTVRTLLADLLDRRARIAFVSLTPEGRALAMAESDRLLRLGVDPDRLVDLGFVPGAEAGLVTLAGALSSGGRPGLGAGMTEPLGGDPVELAVVVGGNDLGPRTWVEQFASRVAGVGLVAVAPSVLLPELRPYLASGQLSALVATPRDGAAYRAAADLGPTVEELVEATAPTELAILAGILLAVAWLGSGLVERVARAVRGAGGRETA
jgi:hypothetical protein